MPPVKVGGLQNIPSAKNRSHCEGDARRYELEKVADATAPAWRSMPNGRIDMRKIRQVLCLNFDNQLSKRAIARSLGISRDVISDYLPRALAAKLTWPLPASMVSGAHRIELKGESMRSGWFRGEYATCNRLSTICPPAAIRAIPRVWIKSSARSMAMVTARSASRMPWPTTRPIKLAHPAAVRAPRPQARRRRAIRPNSMPRS